VKYIKLVADIRKVATRFVIFVHPSVRLSVWKNLVPNRRICKISFLIILQKTDEKIHA